MARNRGLRAEDDRVNQLKEQHKNAQVYRSAASHSLVDVTVIADDEVIIEQLKTVRYCTYDEAKKKGSQSYMLTRRGKLHANLAKALTEFKAIPVPISVTKRFLVRIGNVKEFECLWSN